MALTEPTPNQSKEAISNQTTPTSPEKVKSNTEPKIESPSDSGAIFQAIGVITGDVHYINYRKYRITIGNSQYPLLSFPLRRREFKKLAKQIKKTGNHTQRVVVYPRVVHFPDKERPHKIAFGLVNFEKNSEKQESLLEKNSEKQGALGDLLDLEFKLSGLWQFIPVCPNPCISIYKNFSPSRLEYIKQAQPIKKVKFLRPAHLPMLWSDPPVEPFSFKTEAGKEQGHPPFVSVKAKFLPEQNVFAFEALLTLPQEKAPRFLKALKKDRDIVQQAVSECADNLHA